MTSSETDDEIESEDDWVDVQVGVNEAAVLKRYADNKLFDIPASFFQAVGRSKKKIITMRSLRKLQADGKLLKYLKSQQGTWLRDYYLSKVIMKESGLYEFVKPEPKQDEDYDGVILRKVHEKIGCMV